MAVTNPAGRSPWTGQLPLSQHSAQSQPVFLNQSPSPASSSRLPYLCSACREIAPHEPPREMNRLIPSLVFVLALMGTAEPRPLSYRWEVKLVLDPNTSFEVIAINGETSIPTIRARRGDTIDVEVKNGLEDELTIYWQGIQQGVGRRCNGTDAPFLPGQAVTYCLVANQAGKFLYQSAYKSQRDAGLNGLIVVL